MKNLVKKLLIMTSILGVAVLLSGCTGCGQKNMMNHPQGHPQQKQMAKKQMPNKPMKQNQMQQNQKPEKVVFYQTYEDADITRVHAKMYTHSSHGGQSEMGYIKFNETDAGLKMVVDLKDLRPGVKYNMSIHQCNKCSTGMCCDKNALATNMPTLMIENPGKLEETFILRGINAEQLNNAKIYLERDGGYKAAWGTLKKESML